MTDLGEPLAEGRSAIIYPWQDGQVVKVFRTDWLAKTAAHEAHVGQIVHATGVASPAVYGLDEVNGQAAVIYQRIDGCTLLEAWQRQPWRVAWLGRVLADLHIAMHARTVSGLPSQHERLRRKLFDAAALPAPLREAALRTLDALPSGESLCHNDFHPDNIMVTATGPVIIDWTDATQGHPLADVARTWVLVGNAYTYQANPLLRAAVRRTTEIMVSVYLRRYCRARNVTRHEIEAWLGVVAAARLNERIAEEESALIQLAIRYLPS